MMASLNKNLSAHVTMSRVIVKMEWKKKEKKNAIAHHFLWFRNIPRSNKLRSLQEISKHFRLTQDETFTWA